MIRLFKSESCDSVALSHTKAVQGIRVVFCPTFYRDDHERIYVATGGVLRVVGYKIRELI